MKTKKKLMLAAGIINIIFAIALLAIGIYLAAGYDAVYNSYLTNCHITPESAMYSWADNMISVFCVYNFFACAVSLIIGSYIVSLCRKGDSDLNSDTMLGCSAIITLLCFNPISVVLMVAAACTKTTNQKIEEQNEK